MGEVQRPPARRQWQIGPSVAGGEEQDLSHLRHYRARLRRSQRVRYRIARLLVILLPLVLFLYALALARR
jgi:hypothetical protein